MFNLKVKDLPKEVKESYKYHGQAFSLFIPYLLDKEFPELSILHLDKGKIVLQNKDDERFKVVCGKNNRYDVSPSSTLGCGRTKSGLNIKMSLQELCNGIFFVDISSVDEVIVRLHYLNELTIPDNGVMNFE